MWKEVRRFAWKIKHEAFDASKGLVSIKQRVFFNFKGRIQDSFEKSRINKASIRYNNPEDQNPYKLNFISDFTRSNNLVTIKSHINHA
jgi:hypothetical protein